LCRERGDANVASTLNEEALNVAADEG